MVSWLCISVLCVLWFVEFSIMVIRCIGWFCLGIVWYVVVVR